MLTPTSQTERRFSMASAACPFWQRANTGVRRVEPPASRSARTLPGEMSLLLHGIRVARCLVVQCGEEREALLPRCRQNNNTRRTAYCEERPVGWWLRLRSRCYRSNSVAGCYTGRPVAYTRGGLSRCGQRARALRRHAWVGVRRCGASASAQAPARQPARSGSKSVPR